MSSDREPRGDDVKGALAELAKTQRVNKKSSTIYCLIA
jgi:hypothetical protein